MGLSVLFIDRKRRILGVQVTNLMKLLGIILVDDWNKANPSLLAKHVLMRKSRLWTVERPRELILPYSSSLHYLQDRFDASQ